jgi:LCP family protein required for cell wall assembly
LFSGLFLLINYQTDTTNGYNDKITHAYAFGGIEMALNSIQEFLNVPVDYYVEINMNGLEDLVDAIGGIEITSPLTFEYEGASFVAGDTATLQGGEALAFARMRYDDPEGDTGRQQRQQLVIKAIVNQLLSIEGIPNYEAILSAVEMSMRTNLTFENLVDIQKHYSDTITSYEQSFNRKEGYYVSISNRRRRLHRQPYRSGIIECRTRSGHRRQLLQQQAGSVEPNRNDHRQSTDVL